MRRKAVIALTGLVAVSATFGLALNVPMPVAQGNHAVYRVLADNDEPVLLTRRSRAARPGCNSVLAGLHFNSLPILIPISASSSTAADCQDAAARSSPRFLAAADIPDRARASSGR